MNMKSGGLIGGTGQVRRVAFIHDTNIFGGIETLLISMLNHIDTQRYQPFVVIPGYSDEARNSPQQFIAALDEANVPILKLINPGEIPGISTIKDINNQARLLRRSGIDIVDIQARHPEAAKKATLSARLARVKGIVRTEHLPPAVNMRRFTKCMMKPFDWLTNYILTDSDADREEQIRLVGRNPKKVHRVYCGIKLERFNPNCNITNAKQSIGLNPQVSVIGTIGRLYEQKGHRYFIEAAAHVLQQTNDVAFVLVGDGPLRQSLQDQVRGLGIEQNFHFAGFQSDYIPYMEAMDIGVMPSLWEGFSISMLEFMGLGKPMIVTDHPSFQEALIHEQSAIIVPTYNGMALAQAMLRLLDDRPTAYRLGQYALKKVRTDFSIQKRVNRIMNIYDTILSS